MDWFQENKTISMWKGLKYFCKSLGLSYISTDLRLQPTEHFAQIFKYGKVSDKDIHFLRYYLSLEMLVEEIWSNKQIDGLQIHREEFKCYSDDVVLTITQAAIRPLIKVIQGFGEFSG